MYIYNVRNIYNSNFKYNNVDTVYSVMLACPLLKSNDMPLFTVYVVALQMYGFKVFKSEEPSPCSVY